MMPEWHEQLNAFLTNHDLFDFRKVDVVAGFDIVNEQYVEVQRFSPRTLHGTASWPNSPVRQLHWLQPLYLLSKKITWQLRCYLVLGNLKLPSQLEITSTGQSYVGTSQPADSNDDTGLIIMMLSS